MTSNTHHHEAYLAAHYALGKIEVEQGFTLSDKERSNFLRKYIADYIESKTSESPDSK